MPTKRPELASQLAFLLPFVLFHIRLPHAGAGERSRQSVLIEAWLASIRRLHGQSASRGDMFTSHVLHAGKQNCARLVSLAALVSTTGRSDWLTGVFFLQCLRWCRRCACAAWGASCSASPGPTTHSGH